MSDRVYFTTKTLIDNTKILPPKVLKTGRRALNDIANNLVKASSGAAPHKKGILEDSWTKEVGVDSSFKLQATVSYSVSENSSGGSFNYAIAMHENQYNLGAGSLAKSGGQGLSGKVYPVGNKFLTRVLEGETPTYRKLIDRRIKRTVKNL
ncbi:hypothetical protein [Alkalicoccobacillus gibsonii]|uniref:hypothetical protein n=1 Tax=Alkalicoccobacillus gibsonii TaxID=79881 RepID=UPI00351453D7